MAPATSVADTTTADSASDASAPPSLRPRHRAPTCRRIVDPSATGCDRSRRLGHGDVAGTSVGSSDPRPLRLRRRLLRVLQPNHRSGHSDATGSPGSSAATGRSRTTDTSPGDQRPSDGSSTCADAGRVEHHDPDDRSGAGLGLYVALPGADAAAAGLPEQLDRAVGGNWRGARAARSRLSRRRRRTSVRKHDHPDPAGVSDAVLRDDHDRSVDGGPRPTRSDSPWLADTARRFERRSARTGNRAERGDAGQLPDAGRRCGRRPGPDRVADQRHRPNRGELGDVPRARPTPETVDQTQQHTWQLQIGCLFYCVDSQQVQQSQQSTTTIEIVAGPTSATVQQTIWQVQVGCLAWCWNSTQSQQASQSTIVVRDEPAVRGRFGARTGTRTGPARAPGPAPVSDPPAAASGASTPVPAAPPPAPIPAVAALLPTPANRVGGAVIRVLASPRRSGAAILTSWSVTGVPAPAGGAVPASSSLPARRATAGSVPVRNGAEVPSHRARPAANASPAPVPASLSAAALPTDRSLSGGGSAVALILAILLALTVRRRAYR